MPYSRIDTILSNSLHRTRAGFSESWSLFLVVFCVGFAAQLNAQLIDSTGLAIGEWRTHMPYTAAFDVTACDAYTAWAVPGSIVLQYRENGEVRRLDKVNTLSQSDPAVIACNPFKQGQLIVGYKDGGIDVIENERVVHYTRAIAERDIFGQRDLLEISFASASVAFISAEFGFLLYDPERGVFLEDIRFATSINDVAVYEDDLYLATNKGLRVLPNYTTQPNLRDTNRYLDINRDLFGLGTEPAYAVEVYQGELFVGFRQNLLAVFDQGDDFRTAFTTDSCGIFSELSAGMTKVIATIQTTCGIDQVVSSTDGEAFVVQPDNCGLRFNDAVEDGDGNTALARTLVSDGLCTYTTDSNCRCLDIPGPRSTDVYAIDIRNGIVAAVAGGLDQRNGYTFNTNGLYVFRDGLWTNFNYETSPVFNERGEFDQITSDFIAVDIAEDSSVFAGAYLEGLIEVQPDGSGILYNETNSSLQQHLLDPLRVRISGLGEDSEGNLWVANHGAAQPLSVLQPDGTWMSFRMSCGRARTLALEVDTRSPIIWVVDDENGLMGYDTNGTLEDTSDDECRLFTNADGLPTNSITSLFSDQDGVLWVGSTSGIAKVTCGGSVANCNVSRPVLEQDGLGGLFFDGELIRAIEADGGNRKWIGTDNGLFVLDARTDETVEFFTDDSSPLINNQVRALKFDPTSGQMWIGTGSGMMSLQTESTGGREFAHSLVEVFPQPVKPEYDGPIAIRGLALDSNVKITDVAGRLVYETDAIGGQAVWNGRDYTGRRPASGVYLVWATASRSFDRPATVVAKIAFLN